MNLVELRGVNFSYRAPGAPKEGTLPVPVLRDIDLSIAAGEMVAIQGPSGSGKSTFLYMLGCLLRPDSGTVHIDGQDLARMSPEDLAIFRNHTIGFVFQQFHLLARTSVRENVLLPATYPVEFSSLSVADRTRAENLIENLGLADRIDHLPNQLSGGQQQRVAIARALLRNPKLILADEPTGNLDSKTSQQIMDLLKALNREGKTVLIITHDPEVAAQCSRILHIRDGRVTGQTLPKAAPDTISLAKPGSATAAPSGTKTLLGYLTMAFKLMPQAFDNLRRNKTRSALTMLGITIGVAAVLSMVTLGEFTKERILESYAELGVNTVAFRGYENWEMKATDIVPVVFRQFSWERDLKPLLRIFPSIRRITPEIMSWQGKASYGGRLIDDDVRLVGANEHYASITGRDFFRGKNFSPFHVEQKAAVCVIGYEIASQLFNQVSPIGKVLFVKNDEKSFGCRITGVLDQQSSNKEWTKPNMQIILPYTFLASVSERGWQSEIHHVLLELHDGADIERIGKSVEVFFDKRYGKSGRFRVSSDSKLIGQMKRFLDLFTMMLGTIALICLAVGGIGITNMMLVSVSERLKEIGLRKALGATDLSVRVQFLVESIIICSLAGLIGVVVGFTTYETVIFAASKFVPSLRFELILEPGALVLSLLSILVVGIASGLAPALKAERLQVIEALRAE